MAKKTQKEMTIKKRTARTKLSTPEFAYALQDRIFGEFKVRYSANAWWMESVKLEQLIDGLKRRMTVPQASIRAMITRDQFNYFMEKHPEFSTVIEGCKEVLQIKAKEGLSKLIENVDGATIRWFLEATEAGEYGKKPPVIAVQINMAERVAASREEFSKKKSGVTGALPANLNTNSK